MVHFETFASFSPTHDHKCCRSSESWIGHESRVGQREGDDQLLLPIIVSDPALQMPAGLSTIYCTSTYDRRTGWTEQNKS
jgi:hypothetical protein